MLVVVSPAKKLNMLPVDNVEPTHPLFGQDASELASVMQGLSVDKVKSLMGLSQNLAQLNADRFARFGSQERKPAALAFAGDTLINITIPELKMQLINIVARELKVDLELNEVSF